VVHEETGLLCPAESPAFAGAMARLIEHPATARAWGKTGRQHVALFPWESLVDPIDEYVESLAREATMRVRAPMVLAGRWNV
jgi:glycosyltransferase involved in cell wall biosynthesis